MNTPLLNRQEIFTAHTESNDPDARYLIYAPFAGIHIQASKDTVLRLENISDFPEDKALQATYERLCNKKNRLHKIKTIEETTEICILLNYICNFSCSYCYSAKGRSGKSIDKNKLQTALAFFIDKKRTDANRLHLTFSGGGDPLMSFPLLKEAITYSARLAKLQGFTIRYGVVTNGTLLNQEVVNLVKRYDVNMVISFDVLEDVQNAQRGKYKEVCAGLDDLIKNGIYPGIRSTITPLNVYRMEEMVEEMTNRFPALSGIAFESVSNPSFFCQPSDLNNFYTNFIDCYFKAYELGLQNDFYVGNTIVNNADFCSERACLSKFTLTPEGEITACSRVSSHREDFYEQFHYGTIMSDNKTVLNTDKLYGIMKKNVYSYSDCRSCIAKWHCSGGCLLERYTYGAAYFDIYCDFTRRMLIKTILKLKNK
jgi:radical SAM protein with 4Fe4S-binding SPASM domain